MREILGCTEGGQFVYCIDCKYQDSIKDCLTFISSHNSHVHVSVSAQTGLQAQGVIL